MPLPVPRARRRVHDHQLSQPIHGLRPDPADLGQVVHRPVRPVAFPARDDRLRLRRSDPGQFRQQFRRGRVQVDGKEVDDLRLRRPSVGLFRSAGRAVLPVPRPGTENEPNGKEDQDVPLLARHVELLRGGSRSDLHPGIGEPILPLDRQKNGNLSGFRNLQRSTRPALTRQGVPILRRGAKGRVKGAPRGSERALGRWREALGEGSILRGRRRGVEARRLEQAPSARAGPAGPSVPGSPRPSSRAAPTPWSRSAGRRPGPRRPGPSPPPAR